MVSQVSKTLRCELYFTKYFIDTILEGAVLGGLAFSNCNIVYVLTLLTLTVMLHGANLSSTTPNLIDISPNFTGELQFSFI